MTTLREQGRARALDFITRAQAATSAAEIDRINRKAAADVELTARHIGDDGAGEWLGGFNDFLRAVTPNLRGSRA
jgi:hypothetical protein